MIVRFVDLGGLLIVDLGGLLILRSSYGDAKSRKSR
jgi:hypothetical protein